LILPLAIALDIGISFPFSLSLIQRNGGALADQLRNEIGTYLFVSARPSLCRYACSKTQND